MCFLILPEPEGPAADPAVVGQLVDGAHGGEGVVLVVDELVGRLQPKKKKKNGAKYVRTGIRKTTQRDKNNNSNTVDLFFAVSKAD